MEIARLGLLEAALANTSEGVVITDALLDEPGPKILYVNAAFCSITGYSEAEVLGRNPRFLQGARTDRVELTRLRRELASRNHFHGRAINYRRDGTAFLMDWRISPIVNGDGQVVNYVAFQRDATEESESDDAKQQGQRMEAVGRLTGEIAHNFANLLTGILGFAYLLQEDAGQSMESRETIFEIIRTAERAELLTAELMGFSRTQDVVRLDIDLSDLVERIQFLLTRLLPDGISIDASIPRGVCLVRGTVTELEQIVVNLITNARDAMPDGGKIAIRARRVVIEGPLARTHGVVPGNYVDMRISDTGVGMDDYTKSRLFEPFFTTKDRGKGTGVGLTSVYRHVKKLNGMITVESELGLGSCFHIYLPNGTTP